MGTLRLCEQKGLATLHITAVFHMVFHIRRSGLPSPFRFKSSINFVMLGFFGLTFPQNR
jgi:hypothetical protein